MPFPQPPLLLLRCIRLILAVLQRDLRLSLLLFDLNLLFGARLVSAAHDRGFGLLRVFLTAKNCSGEENPMPEASLCSAYTT